MKKKTASKAKPKDLRAKGVSSKRAAAVKGGSTVASPVSTAASPVREAGQPVFGESSVKATPDQVSSNLFRRLLGG